MSEASSVKIAIAALAMVVALLGIGARADAQSEPKPGRWGAKNEAKVIKAMERSLAKQRTDALLGGFGSPGDRHNFARCTITVLEAEHLSVKKFTSEPQDKLVPSLEAATAGALDEAQGKVLAAGKLCLDPIAPTGAGLGYFDAHNGVDDGRIAAFFGARNTSGCPNGRAANGSCNGQG
jgi:hypothetical protein